MQVSARRILHGFVTHHAHDTTRGLHVAVAAARSTERDDKGAQSSASLPVAPKHWLDRRFPGVREWLEAKNRQWWLKGLTAWCRYVRIH